jgi:hypothetical protein
MQWDEDYGMGWACDAGLIEFSQGRHAVHDRFFGGMAACGSMGMGWDQLDEMDLGCRASTMQRLQGRAGLWAAPFLLAWLLVLGRSIATNARPAPASRTNLGLAGWLLLMLCGF